MNYVIIGNSTAAVGTAEGIRSVDKNGTITMISNEPYHTYSRPLISYLIDGKTDEQRIKYRPDSFYTDNDIKTIFGKTVTKIDSVKKTVELNDGEIISYDKLMNATGSRPFVPPIKGLDTVTKCTTFMSLSDAKKLISMIDTSSRVLIIGAGLIGLKCVECIADKVNNITVLDLADRVMPSVLDSDASKIVKSHIEKKNVLFKLSVSAAEFNGNTALLTNGETLDFDVLVMAVGVRPNTSLISEAGGKVNKGIIIDKNGSTSLPDIFAAGDCTETTDISSGNEKIMAILPNAYMGGHAAGVTMAGGAENFDNPIPMNSIGFFGLHMVTAGAYEGEKISVTSDDGAYKKLFVKDNELKGFIIVGNIRSAGIYTTLIRNKIPLDKTDFKLLLNHPTLAAFDRAYRDEKLGGKNSDN